MSSSLRSFERLRCLIRICIYIGENRYILYYQIIKYLYIIDKTNNAIEHILYAEIQMCPNQSITTCMNLFQNINSPLDISIYDNFKQQYL